MTSIKGKGAKDEKFHLAVCNQFSQLIMQDAYRLLDDVKHKPRNDKYLEQGVRIGMAAAAFLSKENTMTKETFIQPHSDSVVPLQESTQQLVDDAKLYARHHWRTGWETADGIRAEMLECVKERPFVTLFAALGIGLVVGKIMGCGKR